VILLSSQGFQDLSSLYIRPSGIGDAAGL